MVYTNELKGIFVPKTTEFGKDLINLEYVPVEPHKFIALSYLQKAKDFYENVREHLYNVNYQLNGLNPFFNGYAEIPNISNEQRKGLNNSKKFLEDLLVTLKPN